MLEKPLASSYKFNSNISDIISKFEINQTTSLQHHRLTSKHQDKNNTTINGRKMNDDNNVGRNNNVENNKSVLIKSGGDSMPSINEDDDIVYGQQRACKTNVSGGNRFSGLLQLLPLSFLSVTTGTGIICLLATFVLPRSISDKITYPAFRLLFGTLYPGYASYKAIRTKNVKEYVSKLNNFYENNFHFNICI